MEKAPKEMEADNEKMNIRDSKLTGPISNTGVSSRTFSIGALEGSNGGGSKSVTLLAMIDKNHQGMV